MIQKLHKSNPLKIILGIVFTFSVLISSCAVKSSIKKMLDIPVPTSPGSSAQSVKLLSACQYSAVKENEPIHNLKLNKTNTALLITAVFIFLSIPFSKQLLKEKLFYKPEKAEVSLPIFLQYRKLII